MCRREDPDPGARPDATQAADEKVVRHETHDYKRNGTTRLFAALSVSTDRLSVSTPRHRHQEFLNLLAHSTASSRARDLHLMLTTTEPTNTRTSSLAPTPPPLSSSTSHRPQAPGSTSSNAGSANSQTKHSAAASSTASPTSPSAINALPRTPTTTTPNPSSGPPRSTPSSKKSDAVKPF